MIELVGIDISIEKRIILVHLFCVKVLGSVVECKLWKRDHPWENTVLGERTNRFEKSCGHDIALPMVVK